MKRLAINILIILSVFFSAAWAQNMDSLKLALKKSKHDTTSAQILLELGFEILNNQPDRSLNLWNKTNNFCIQKMSNYTISSKEYKSLKFVLATSLGSIGYIYSERRDVQNALKYSFKSLKLFQEMNIKDQIAATSYNIGRIYLSIGETYNAVDYLESSLINCQEGGNKIRAGAILNDLATIYKDKGNIQKSIDYNMKSLKLREELGNKKGVATSCNNIGNIYMDQGNFEQALDYYNKSLQIYLEIGYKEGIATLYNNIGFLYANQPKLKKNSKTNIAVEYFNKSLKLSIEMGLKNRISTSYNNLGLIYEGQGDFKKALGYFKSSLTISEEMNRKEEVSCCYINLGRLYYEEKEYLRALKHLDIAILISKELGYPYLIRDASKEKYKVYKALSNHKLAFDNYELFIRMRDSIINLETQKATIKQQTQYEYDKKKAVEDEKHAAELKVQDEKAQADKKRQNIIIGSVSVVLLLVAIFSLLLYNRFKTTQKQKHIIEVKERETQSQKHIIEEKQKEILDSINYAKRIQYTLLAHDEFLKANLPEHFTYFNPKDIVSGDFYWATKHNDKFYLAVCDSTGHGVPGAFMSLLNIGFLSEAINEKGIEKPNEVFDYVRMKLTNTISKEGQKDGFDGILVCFDQKNKSITYAAANNAPILIKAALRQAQGPVAELVEANADRMPVGVGERKENFALHTIDANPGDMLYLYTDGYADQFGGPKGKKFKYKQLNELLVSLHTKPLNEQHSELKSAFEKWKGDLEQVDDVCLIGIRI